MAHGNETEISTTATDTTTAATADQLVESYADLTLDCLHGMAKSGTESAASRRAAQRVIDERARMVALANEPRETTTAYRVTLKTSMYGTPQPTVEVLVSGPSDRHARASGLELAADVERALATTREKWHVHAGMPMRDRDRDVLRVDVSIGLMTADPAEARRAIAVLEGVTGKRARRRGARADGVDGADGASGVDGASGEADGDGSAGGSSGSSGSTGATGATGGNEDPHGGRIRRRRRQQFRDLAGKDATAFEARMLAGDRAAMPVCAQVVVDGGQRSAEFWVWLGEQYRAQKIDDSKDAG